MRKQKITKACRGFKNRTGAKDETCETYLFSMGMELVVRAMPLTDRCTQWMISMRNGKLMKPGIASEGYNPNQELYKDLDVV